MWKKHAHIPALLNHHFQLLKLKLKLNPTLKLHPIHRIHVTEVSFTLGNLRYN